MHVEGHIRGYPIPQYRTKNWQIPKYRVENRPNTDCHMLAFIFLFGTIFKRLAPIYHVCYTATALSANSPRGGSTKSLNCHFECGEEPGDEFRTKKNLGKFISASVQLFLDLRIIPDRPESRGEAFIPSRKMLMEII